MGGGGGVSNPAPPAPTALICGRNQCQEGGSDPGNALLKQNTSTLPTTSKHSVILIEKSEKCLQEIVFSEQKIA